MEITHDSQKKDLYINEKIDQVEVVTVNMGEPILEAEKIPVKLEKSPVKNQPIWVEGDEYKVTSPYNNPLFLMV